MATPATVNDARLTLDPSGAAFWPEQRTLVVADLHFEKGSSFARGGRFLPPYDTRTTLDRLAQVVRLYKPARIVALGDSFHDRDAAARLAELDADRLRRIIAGQEWVWVAGNHDPAPPADLGGSVVDVLELGSLVLRHQPEDGTTLAVGGVCGHFHPKAAVNWRGRRLAGACFATDSRRLILPAFGAYAGGLDVSDPAIASQFGRSEFRVHLIGRDRLFTFPARSLDRTVTAPRVGDTGRLPTIR